jgi:hypothetical protein
MSDITIINDTQQSELVTNGLAKNGELYLKAEGSTDAGAIVVYDSGAWRTFANDYAPAGFSNNYSVSLDGTNDYLSLASTINLPDGPRTISAWVNFSSVSGTFNTIVGATAGNGYRGLHWSPSNGYIYFYGVDQTGRYKNYTGSITTNTWYHLMIVDNDSGSAGNFKIYVNGTDIGTPAPSANTTAPLAMEFEFIGKGGSSNEFPGLIDEVAIWNSDQSANLSEIRDTSGANPVPGDLSLMTNQPLHWWRMGDNDSGSGSTVTDQGSAGVDATLVNGASFSTNVPS